MSVRFAIPEYPPGLAVGAPPTIAVVIPAFRSAALIADVIARIPPEVRHVIVVEDVAMHPAYGDEVSSLSPVRSLFEFSGRLANRTLRRIGLAYFLKDFNVVSVFIASGLPLFVFGILWSVYHWYRSWVTNVVATTGTVMIGALAIILGFQLLLQAVVLDVQNEPGRAPR